MFVSFRALLAGWISEAGEAAVSPNDGLCHSSHRLSLVRKPLGRSARAEEETVTMVEAFFHQSELGGCSMKERRKRKKRKEGCQKRFW